MTNPMLWSKARVAEALAAMLFCCALSACSGGGDDAGSGGGLASQDRAAGAAGTSAGSGGTGASMGNENFGAPVAGAGGGFSATGGTSASAPPLANTNVSLGGAQDFGQFRSQLASGQVPQSGTFDAAGFFAEHHTALPEPTCGERVCLQSMLGVLGSLMSGSNCTMLQLGLNSPIAADASKRPSLRLAVVIDVSGSMQTGDKIGFVREGLGLLIDGMRDADELALITYSDGARVIAQMGEISLRRAELRTLVQNLVAGGGTNLHGGLELGYREVLEDYDSGRQNRVILLSDGQPTAGITGESAILGMSRGYNSDGIGLSTIGLGQDFNTSLMRGLGEQGDGNSYFLENSGAVSEVFTEELSYFTVPVAFDLRMEVEAGPYYTLRAAYGSSFWDDTAKGGVLEVPSVFLAHRESAADVTVDGGRRGGGSALMLELGPTLSKDDGSGISEAVVATVKVSFREPGTDRTVSDRIDVRFPMAPWLLPKRGFFDSPDLSIIQKSFVMLNIYVAFETASTSYYSGERGEALETIERVLAGVEDYNDEVGDTDIDYDLMMLRDLRDLIRREISPPPTQIPEDPWPAD